MGTNSRQINVWLLAGWACLLTTVIGIGVIKVQSLFFKHNAYFFDDISYSFGDVGRSISIEQQGRLKTAVDDWLHNGRSPMRTIPLTIFAPELLKKKLGHLATALPMLALFLFLLGMTVWRRTRSFSYAMAIMLLFLMLPGLYELYSGLGTHWLDLPASFLAGAAALCLINSEDATKLKWLAAFALLASLAALSRYVASAFVFVSCFPVLFSYLLLRFLHERKILHSLIIPALVILLIIGVTAGYFLFAHFESNRYFYSNYGYALHNTIIKQATENVTLAVKRYFIYNRGSGRVVALLFGSLSLLQIFLAWETKQWKQFIISTWLVVSVPFFMIFILKTSATQTIVYMVPLLFFFIVNAVPWKGINLKAKWLNLFLFGVLILAPARFWQIYEMDRDAAIHPSIQNSLEKEMTISLAKHLARWGNGIKWASFFDEYSIIVDMECYYRFNVLPYSAPQSMFNAHESAWLADYPGMAVEAIAEKILSIAVKTIKIAVVYEDPEQALINPSLRNQISRRVAWFLSQEIPKKWKKIFILPTQKYGYLAGYINPLF